jgi:ABC-type antimicrobial peptide transport system permease subunit
MRHAAAGAPGGADHRLVGLVATLLAAVGLYGVIAYSVGRRTREIGIRMALGAAPGDVLKMVMGQGVGLAAGGIALGLALSFVAARAIAAALYDVGAADPAAWGTAIVVLLDPPRSRTINPPAAPLASSRPIALRTS